MKLNVITLAVGLGIVAASSSAHAAIAGKVEVALQVSSGCEVTSGSSASAAGVNDFGTLNFGQTGPTWRNNLNAQNVGSGTGAGAIEVTCSADQSSFSVAIDGGVRGNRSLLRTGGAVGAAADVVSYNLSSDAAGANPFVVGQSQSYPVTAGTPVPVRIFGSIAPVATGSAKAAGAYTDTLLVTVSL
ncbi:Spore Coat Protein U domain protein [compost metagenome]